jgi:hypothetical protein
MAAMAVTTAVVMAPTVTPPTDMAGAIMAGLLCHLPPSSGPARHRSLHRGRQLPLGHHPHRRLLPSGRARRLVHRRAVLHRHLPADRAALYRPATLVCSSPCAGRHPGGAPAACRAGRQPAGAAGPGRRVETAARLDFLPAVKVCCTADTGTLGFGLGQCFQPADSPRSQASTAAWPPTSRQSPNRTGEFCLPHCPAFGYTPHVYHTMRFISFGKGCIFHVET